MSGIVFFNTTQLEKIVPFYIQTVKAEIWLDQGKCVILKHNNLLFGFCKSEATDNEAILTFFYQTQEEVIDMYNLLKNESLSDPKENPEFKIFNFFAQDPDGRTIEFQTFNHHLNPYQTGEQLLLHRRSVRSFLSDDVKDLIMDKVFELCRYSPTSRNSQAYYYVMTRNKELADKLASIKSGGGKPLLNAPIVVAVCINPEQTIRAEQDASIAAAYFLLAAAQYGLGTCWIGGMDLPDVKALLDIPTDHHIACLTPVGYPSEINLELPKRRSIYEFVRIVD